MSRRPLLRRLARWLVVPLLLLLGWFGGLRWWEVRLGDVLVRELLAQAPARFERPVHVDVPAPGTFAEALEPLLVEARALYARQEPVRRAHAEVWRAVQEGAQPISQLPAPVGEALETGRPLLLRVLRATHVSTGGLPLVGRGGEADVLLALQHLARLGALDVRAALAAGEPERALNLCLDGLALGREISLGAPLIALMQAHAVVGIFTPACASALEAVPVARQRAALVQLSRLRQGWGTASAAFHLDVAWNRLYSLGPVLTETQRAALPSELHHLTRPAESQQGLLPELLRPFVLHGWEHLPPHFHAHAEALRLPPAERRPALAAVLAAADAERNPLIRISLAPGFVKFLWRAEAGEARLALLEAAARAHVAHAATGRWPGAGEVVGEAPPAGSAVEVGPDGELQLSYQHPELEELRFALTLRADGATALAAGTR
ncbi:MAG TPA: hypothetical protein VFO83_15875 [Aggregicoccus sp.]|nr:hypothetical protein [Aggregicoccus sp.]